MNYRVYHLDSASKIVGAHWIDAADDERAIDIVRDEGAAHDCELWAGPRYIGKVVRSAEVSALNW